MRHLQLRLHAQRLSVHRKAVGMLRLIVRVVDILAGRIVRLLQHHHIVRGVVGHHEEGIPAVLGDLRNLGEILKHIIRLHKGAVKPGGGIETRNLLAGRRRASVLGYACMVVVAAVIERTVQEQRHRLHERIAEEVAAVVLNQLLL